MTTDSSFMSGDEHVDDDVRDDDYRVHTDICNQADYYQKIADKSALYRCVDHLSNDINEMNNTSLESKFYFIQYRINCTGDVPFLEIGMTRDEESQTMKCCTMNYLDYIGISGNARCKGYKYYNGAYYVFFHVDVGDDAVQLVKTTDPDVVYVVMDEVVNKGYVYEMMIESGVCDFFTENNEFSFVHSYDHGVYETPIVGYTRTLEKYVRYVEDLGTGRADESAPLGAAYYFTSFDNAQDDSIHRRMCYINPDFVEEEQGEQSVICRFVVFAGKTKVILNRPDDEPDTSEYKKYLLTRKDSAPAEHMTMRITDHDGKWMEWYDTAYLGNVMLDNGEYYRDGPVWAVQNYHRQQYIDHRKC